MRLILIEFYAYNPVYEGFCQAEAVQGGFGRSGAIVHDP